MLNTSRILISRGVGVHCRLSYITLSYPTTIKYIHICMTKYKYNLVYMYIYTYEKRARVISITHYLKLYPYIFSATQS